MASLDVVIPVYNEQAVLAESVAKLRQFLTQHLRHRWTIVIANNGSTDGTAEVGRSLSREYPDVRLIDLDVRGRGWALYYAWRDSEADIVSYMDVDLSTGLDAFPELIRAIEDGYDLAIGSRLVPGSRVKRSLSREFLSRGYNLLVRLLLLASVSDTQCGFKAIRTRAAKELLPLIKDRQWFFDTELLILARKKGYRVKEIPVSWVEDPGSKVAVLRTVLSHLRELLRMRLRRSSS